MTTPSIVVKQRLLLKGDAKVLQKSDKKTLLHQKKQIVVSEIIIIQPKFGHIKIFYYICKPF